MRLFTAPVAFGLFVALASMPGCAFDSDLIWGNPDGTPIDPNSPRPPNLQPGQPIACAAPPCDDGGECKKDEDCVSRRCHVEPEINASWCIAETAFDGVKNGTESDVDCGGHAAPKCMVDAECREANDCRSLVCDPELRRCMAPSATDGVRNGGESDVDCGGTSAPGCATGRNCYLGSDCENLVCSYESGQGVCSAPTSTDGVQNGNETGIDCGSNGPGINTGAPGCATGQGCVQGTDCESRVCGSNDRCQPASGTDNVQNGDESDVDCGGSITGALKCRAGRRCNLHTDCESNGCIEAGQVGAGTCAVAPSCTTFNGGFTCGAGEIADNANAPGPGHESCCTSLPVPPGFEDPVRPGKRVYLDKYEITTGRVRRFIQQITQQYNGKPNVRQWVIDNLAGRPGVRWNHTGGGDPYTTVGQERDWTRWMPVDTGGRPVADPNDPLRINYDSNAVQLFPGHSQGGGNPGAWGNVGTDYLFGMGAYLIYIHGHNCPTGTLGYASYWYPPNVQQEVHGGTARWLSQANLDRRSMNCAPLAFLAAFCAWDGGQLATHSVLAHVTGVPYESRHNFGAIGRLPAQSASNFSTDAGYNATYNVPANPNDYAARVAPPGRVTTDRVEFTEGGQQYGPWMDLRGNLQEASILDEGVAGMHTPRFSGWHYGGLGSASLAGDRDMRAQWPEFKTATVGARCMRFRDE